MAIKKPTTADTALAFAEAPAKKKVVRSKSKPKKVAKKAPQTISGLVPDGDVRLTANVRSDLHMKLKMHSVLNRTTIGEILEELIEENIK